jgi:hypothetical protein
MRGLIFVVAAIAGTNGWAQSDPCALIGQPGGNLRPSTGGHECTVTVRRLGTMSGESVIGGVEPRLLAMQIDRLRDISQSQQQLAAAVQALANATSQLAQASNNLLASNTAWRKDALDKTIAQISAIPATLAQNKELVDTLTEVLADRLARTPVVSKTSDPSR